MPEAESKNDITNLRAHLFDTLTALKDKEKPMDLDRAKAIADVAQVIINTAKAENDFMKISGNCSGTDFIAPAPRLPTGVTVHKLK